MPEDTVSTLVISSVRGRYALDNPLHGQDITTGQALAILLGGHAAQPISSGYYFLASDGNVCGLCAGMHVRMR